MEMKLAAMPIAASLALAIAACLSPAAAGSQPVVADRDQSAAVGAMLSQSWGVGAKDRGNAGPTTTAAWDARSDLGSMYALAASSGAESAWRADGAGITGLGVTVAVIDTGISPVRGLNAAGKVVNGPDLSAEGSSKATRYVDSFGHGTNMAGIIAGNDSSAATGVQGAAAPFRGIAPDAQLLNMKVASGDGAVDVSSVIAAVDWVVAHRSDDGMNVRVINLSSGVSTSAPYTVDPLAEAVERAWAAGIVVVAAAGNDGGTADLTMPAADPYVIAVGSSDNQGTSALADDLLSTFTNPGTAVRGPDLLAPGKSVVSLRVPGSTVDQEHPEGLVAGDTAGRYFRGTGTSQAAAVVSGAVALLLQATPSLTPDQVKYVLEASAEPMPAESNPARGAGQVNIERALSLPTPSATTALQSWTAAAPIGSIAAAIIATATTTAWHWSAWHWSAWHWSAWHWSAWHWSAWHWSAWHWSAWHWSAWHWSAWHWSAWHWSAWHWSAWHWS
ncbi:peptidase S8 and S53 subtilisin kexin sedolisin [Pengzhenrongella frigida]|uniref:Peptidase S8 and S53 subtilisin kexin sedolisin n=1 Tax=Pengzhenrongella frigida TaxID=1259133 RepID=A0A4V1ZGV0_9MICO|nr:S8 family serine peptidase [Cellulomonas sp. HLT2-17]RYV49814.1 peptidase S8 and S53 subtilisin kexin sedolisin [Cellulomonas sp. HLT2-17]